MVAFRCQAFLPTPAADPDPDRHTLAGKPPGLRATNRQRTGIATEDYSVLNIHRIGIEAPARHVFEELFVWDGDSTCWPNSVAAVERVGGTLDEIRVSLFGIRSLPLFSLRSLKHQSAPDTRGGDNARYLLYECGGGYPIGMFCLYVRSAIAAIGERENTQFFVAVGFDFYGKRDWSHQNLIHRSWAAIHNRVTANVLNRFKQLCEWRFQRLQGGVPGRGIGREPARTL
jgi:hypothetical protein